MVEVEAEGLVGEAREHGPCSRPSANGTLLQ